MSDSYLLCNIVKCRKELKTQAWITFCSHIFCMDHGQNAIDKEKCLVCDTVFSNKYDTVLMNLNPCEQHKTMILTGLSPEKVIDIATRSLSFWTYQMQQERLLRDSELKAAKHHSSEIADYCESVMAKHKLEVQKLFREIQCYQKEIEEKGKQIEDFTMQLMEKSKLIKNLQSQNDSLKRSLGNYMRLKENNDQQPNAESMKQILRPCNLNYSYNRPNCEPESQNFGRHSSEIQYADFVFKPNTTSTYPKKYNYHFK